MPAGITIFALAIFAYTVNKGLQDRRNVSAPGEKDNQNQIKLRGQFFVTCWIDIMYH